MEKEILTEELAAEYRKRALNIGTTSNLYVGEIRRLANELRNRCEITELEAINILNGNHILEYVRKYDRKLNNIDIDKEEHKKTISFLQQEEEAADRRAMEDDGW